MYHNLLKTFAGAGIKLPIHSENKILLSESKLRLKPGNKVSLFAETGLQWKVYTASIMYEGMRFSKSDTVTRNGIDSWQPESMADMFGLNIRMVF